MNFSDWLLLSEEDRDKTVQTLNHYEDWDLFKAVEAEFISQFGNQKGVGNVFCGLDPGLGPYYVITVAIIPGQPKTKLTKKFLGFPVERKYK